MSVTESTCRSLAGVSPLPRCVCATHTHSLSFSLTLSLSLRVVWALRMASLQLQSCHRPKFLGLLRGMQHKVSGVFALLALTLACTYISLSEIALYANGFGFSCLDNITVAVPAPPLITHHSSSTENWLPRIAAAQCVRPHSRGWFNFSFPSPRWKYLKRLSELHLPWFRIKIFRLGIVAPLPLSQQNASVVVTKLASGRATHVFCLVGTRPPPKPSRCTSMSHLAKL